MLSSSQLHRTACVLTFVKDFFMTVTPLIKGKK